MANLSVTPTDVAPIYVVEQLTLPAAEAISAGQPVRLDTTSGKATLANATSAAEGRVIGIAVSTAGVGEAVTIVKRGLVDLGDALTAQAIDALVQLSNTDGTLDVGGVPTGAYNVGRVYPAFGATTADKVLLVDIATHYA